MLPAAGRWASSRPAASLLSWWMPCSCSLWPLPGVFTLGLCHSPWPKGAGAAWQMGQKGPAPWPCPPDHHLSSHPPTGLFSALAWHRGGCLLCPNFPNPLPKAKLHREGRLGTSRYPEVSSACPLAETRRSPVPFCTSTKVAGVKTHHRAVSQFWIPRALSLRTNHI